MAVHPSDAPHVRYATVAAVNTDGTLDVTIDGTTLRGMCATTGCVGAAEGMRCVVLRQGPLATVVGLVANTDLADVTDGWHGTTAASIVTGGFVHYMTFGNIAVVHVQDVAFGTTAPATNDATICSGLPHAAGSNFIFPLKTAQQAETDSMRVRITAAGLMQTHYANATTASTSRQWHGLAVYPYTR